MIIVYLLIIVIAIVVNCLISAEFASVAADKGYDHGKYFWYCFFLSTAGYILVAALPDRGVKQTGGDHFSFREDLRQGNAPRETWEQKQAVIGDGGWQCTCGRANAKYIATCTCGVNKRDVVKKEN